MLLPSRAASARSLAEPQERKMKELELADSVMVPEQKRGLEEVDWVPMAASRMVAEVTWERVGRQEPIRQKLKEQAEWKLLHLCCRAS